MFQLLVNFFLASIFLPAGVPFISQQPADFLYAQPAAATNGAPERIGVQSLGIVTTASGITIADEQSGSLLYQKNPTRSAPIASITKLITALTFLEHNPGWQQRVTITSDDQRQGGMVHFLPGEQVTVRDLFFAMLTASSNEAAVALSRVATTDNFVSAMNATAARIGMADSTFVEPTGLNPANVATPRDLVALARAALAQPDIAAATTKQSYPFTVLNSGRRGIARATDQLLGSFLNQGTYSIVGGKTGYLDEAGYCLVLHIRRADGRGLVIALLGAQTTFDRWQETKGLIDWVLKHYRWPEAPLK